MSKGLLSEHQVQRFMKLAELSSIKETETVEEGAGAALGATAGATKGATKGAAAGAAAGAKAAEDLEEGGLADRDDPRNRRNTERSRPMEEGEVSEGEETIEEVDLGDVAKDALKGAKTGAMAGLAAGPLGSLAAAPLGAMAGGAKSVADQVMGRGATPAPSFDGRIPDA